MSVFQKNPEITSSQMRKTGALQIPTSIDSDLLAMVAGLMGGGVHQYMEGWRFSTSALDKIWEEKQRSVKYPCKP